MSMRFVRGFTNLFQFNRKNWKAIILCFLAAATFWLFSAFNKNHNTTLRFPLQFEFDKERYVAVKPLPNQIRINVSGSGWELFRKTLGIKLPELIIPLEQPSELKKLPAIGLTPIIASQLGGLKINYMVTDSLLIQLDERKSKTFRIAVDISKLTFREGFGSMGDLRVVPDTVIVDGPRSIINAIPDTIILVVKAAQLNKSLNEELEVPLFGSESVNRNPPVVEVHLSIGPVEVIEAMIKVKAVNQSRKPKSLLTDSVKVLIQIPVDKSEDFKSKLSEVIALVNVKDLESGEDQLYPMIIGLPAYARVVSIDSVAYKIDKHN